MRSYRLEDPERRLGSRELYEYDIVFDKFPVDIEGVICSWLRAVLDAQAEACWFAFEGSFHFDHLLTADVADQVYAVADARGISVALTDEHRESVDWTTAVEAVRNRLFAASEPD